VLPEGLAAKVAARKVGTLEKSVPVVVSTLQSIRRGRPTEIDYLNGEIARFGRELGVATPLNEAVVALVHAVETDRAYLTPAQLRATIEGRAAGLTRRPS